MYKASCPSPHSIERKNDTKESVKFNIYGKFDKIFKISTNWYILFIGSVTTPLSHSTNLHKNFFLKWIFFYCWIWIKIMFRKTSVNKETKCKIKKCKISKLTELVIFCRSFNFQQPFRGVKAERWVQNFLWLWIGSSAFKFHHLN